MASPFRNARREFTLDMWDQWRSDRLPDAHTLVLREGIRELRARLELLNGLPQPQSDIATLRRA